MQTLPAELLNLIVVFQPLFTKPTWENAQLLLQGARLARGKRTVTACLRGVGLGAAAHFQNYHRVLNRAKWSSLDVARALLGLILPVFAGAAGEVIILAADARIERRRGKKIKQVRCYRDPVRSSKQRIIKCFGLKWLALLVKLPWAVRASRVAVFHRLVPGATRRPAVEGLALAQPPQGAPEQAAQSARQDGRQKEVWRDRRHAATTHNGGRYAGESDPLGAALAAGTRAGAGGRRRLGCH